MDAREKVKADIISWFREDKADVGHAFNERSFATRYVTNYNPKEKAAYEGALRDLTVEEIIEQKSGRLLLTQKGLDLIYPESPAEARGKVKADIISWFREANADIGDAFNERSFMTRYATNYNPKEKGVILGVLSELATEGLLEERGGKFFLTKRGIDTLY
jgi:hypothetical protein